MKLLLHTETTFDSCHQLIGYDGKCAQMHGHTWKIEIWFNGFKKDVDEVGILVDFGIVKLLKEELDHKDITHLIKLDDKEVNPTAENLAQWIHNFVIGEINTKVQCKVRLYETAVGKETWCEYGDFE